MTDQQLQEFREFMDYYDKRHAKWVEETHKPYCEHAFGQFMCSNRVKKWGHFCSQHRGKED